MIYFQFERSDEKQQGTIRSSYDQDRERKRKRERKKMAAHFLILWSQRFEKQERGTTE